jgi:hypothetical protein
MKKKAAKREKIECLDDQRLEGAKGAESVVISWARDGEPDPNTNPGGGS